GQRVLGIAGAQVEGLGGARNGGRSRDVPGPHHGPQRLTGMEGPVGQACGQLGAVDAGGPGPDQHDVAGCSQLVDPGAGPLPGDPAAGAVGGGDAAVEGQRHLRGDQGAPALQPVLPAAVECRGFDGESIGNIEVDVDPCCPQAVDAAGGDRVQVTMGDHDAGDARGDQG